mgnify:CR=1 FL=1
MGVFCSPFRGPVPLLDSCFCLFWAVLSLPSVCFWSSPWFLSCCGSSVLCFSVGVSACDFAVVFSLAFVCRLWCCGASLFAVFVVLWAAPLPRWLLSPSPLRLFPCGVLVQLLCWSLPLGIWLLHVTARLPCPNAWGVVVLCFLASSCFMAAKAFGPVWGFVLPSTHGACVVVVLCTPALRYSS